MRHPFDGLIVPENQPDISASVPDVSSNSVELSATRRSALGLIGALVGAAAGLFGTREAAAQSGRVTTQALGEEGGYPRPGPRPPGHGGYPPPGHGGYPPGHRRRATTLMTGEEGGRGNQGDRVTTYALGEEGGRWRRTGWDDEITTEAVGEEGGRPGYPRW